MTDTEQKMHVAINEMLPPEMQCTKQFARSKAQLLRLERDTFEPIGAAANRVVDRLSRRRP
jgi:hypothetical protein